MKIIERLRNSLVRYRRNRQSKINATGAAEWFYITLVLLSLVCLFVISRCDPDGLSWTSFLMYLSVAFLQLAVGIYLVNFILSKIENKDNRRMASYLLGRSFKKDYSRYCVVLEELSDFVEESKRKTNSIAAQKEITVEEYHDTYDKIIDRCKRLDYVLYDCMDSLKTVMATGIFNKDGFFLKACNTITDSSDEIRDELMKNMQYLTSLKMDPTCIYNISLAAAFQFKNEVDSLLRNLDSYRDDFSSK